MSIWTGISIGIGISPEKVKELTSVASATGSILGGLSALAALLFAVSSYNKYLHENKAKEVQTLAIDLLKKLQQLNSELSTYAEHRMRQHMGEKHPNTKSVAGLPTSQWVKIATHQSHKTIQLEEEIKADCKTLALIMNDNSLIDVSKAIFYEFSWLEKKIIETEDRPLSDQEKDRLNYDITKPWYTSTLKALADNLLEYIPRETKK